MTTSIDLKFFSISYFFIFLLFSIISAFLMIHSGQLGGDFISFKINISPAIVVAQSFKLIFFDMFFLVVCYKISSHYSAKPASITINKLNSDESGIVDYIILFLQIFSIGVVSLTNTGTVFRGDENHSRLADLIFAFTQPFYLSILYFYSRSNSKAKILNINLLLFMISCYASGFLGYFFYIIPLIFLKFNVRIKKYLTCSFVILSILIFPFIRILKYSFISRQKFNDILFNDPDQGPIFVYLKFARIVIDRFSNVANYIYIEKYASYLQQLLVHDFYPFFQSYPGSLVHKLWYGYAPKNINEFIYHSFSKNYGSNSTFPLFSYFSLSLNLGISILLYSLLILSITTLILSKFLGRQELIFLIGFTGYTLLAGGWFWPYMNFLQAGIIYTCMLYLINYKNQTVTWSN
ncbi:MAG: oligosaccharide repeat unit polymerase [Candidatus Dependentiae bacterium]|nr:oligosaccharide repeat unit polymerase [Candidatus Dependentiae bacterium]